MKKTDKNQFSLSIVFKLYIVNISAQNTTLNNVAIGTDALGCGVNIKTNIPEYTGNREGVFLFII